MQIVWLVPSVSRRWNTSRIDVSPDRDSRTAGGGLWKGTNGRTKAYHLPSNWIQIGRMGDLSRLYYPSMSDLL